METKVLRSQNSGTETIKSCDSPGSNNNLSIDTDIKIELYLICLRCRTEEQKVVLLSPFTS